MSYARRIKTIFVKIFYNIKSHCKWHFRKGRGVIFYVPNTQFSKLTATSQGNIFGAGTEQIIL